MHAIEKLLAKKAGLDSVKTGQIINCEIDLAGLMICICKRFVPFLKWGRLK